MFCVVYCTAKSGSTLTMKILERFGWPVAMDLHHTVRESGELRNALRDCYMGVSATAWSVMEKSQTDIHGRWCLKVPNIVLPVADIRHDYPDHKAIYLFRDPAGIAKRDLTIKNRRNTLNQTIGHQMEMYWMYSEDADKSFVLSYEKLLSTPRRELRHLAIYLDTPVESSVINDIATHIKPEVGYVELKDVPE